MSADGWAAATARSLPDATLPAVATGLDGVTIIDRLDVNDIAAGPSAPNRRTMVATIAIVTISSTSVKPRFGAWRAMGRWTFAWASPT